MTKIEKRYVNLETKEDLAQVDSELFKDDKPTFELMALDTETNGLCFWRDVVIGFSFSLDSSSGYYVPLLVWEPNESSAKQRTKKGTKLTVYEKGNFRCWWTGKSYPENVTNKEYKVPDFIIKYAKKWFSSPGISLLMHNAPFDVLMIKHNFGIDLTDNLFCDTLLFAHAVDENCRNGLKERAIYWQKELGFDVEEAANKEQLEMGASITQNGGKFGKLEKHVWRSAYKPLAKYAIADTALTFGIFEVCLQKFEEDYEEKHFKWFFEDEVMPVCREVVIPMKDRGVFINVPYFQELEVFTRQKLDELEDEFITAISEYIKDFKKGKAPQAVVNKKKIIEKIIKIEGLEYPTEIKKRRKQTDDGVIVIEEIKKSLSKKSVEKAYAESGHWLWAWILGEQDLPYSAAEMQSLEKEIYRESIGKRYQFNITSDAHLRWLFFEKLKMPTKDHPLTESGALSVKAEVLKGLFVKKFPWVKKLLTYKKLQKLHSTYLVPALQLQDNGYIRVDMNQGGTSSGRFSCSGGFNLQTLPKLEELDRCPKCGSKDVVVAHESPILAVLGCNTCEYIEGDIVCPSAIKAGFIAPPDEDIVNADYSSLEPRVFAFMSGDPKLKEVYQKGLDLYSKVYCDMLDDEGKYSADPKAPNFLKKVDNEKRSMAKPVVLGIPYGARAPQTAKLMKFKKKIIKDGQQIEMLDVEKGKWFRDLYLDTYKELRGYMERCELEAMTKGYVETIVGRRRHFKFTVPVHKLLCKAGITVEEFLDMKRKKLETQYVNDVLSKKALEKLSEKCGFQMYLVGKQGQKIPRTWGFVRSLFKNELNNAKNFPIQGLAAHITNKAMLDMNRAIKQAGIKAGVCLNVHDEITTYSSKKDTPITAKLLQQSMEKNVVTALLDVPMEAEPLIAQNLKDAK